MENISLIQITRGFRGFEFSIKDSGNCKGSVLVSQVRPGGSADKAGLQVGSLIVAVNGQPVNDSSFLEVSNLIRRSSGLSIELAVLTSTLTGQEPISSGVGDKLKSSLVADDDPPTSMKSEGRKYPHSTIVDAQDGSSNSSSLTSYSDVLCDTATIRRGTMEADSLVKQTPPLRWRNADNLKSSNLPTELKDAQSNVDSPGVRRRAMLLSTPSISSPAIETAELQSTELQISVDNDIKDARDDDLSDPQPVRKLAFDSCTKSKNDIPRPRYLPARSSRSPDAVDSQNMPSMNFLPRRLALQKYELPPQLSSKGETARNYGDSGEMPNSIPTNAKASISEEATKSKLPLFTSGASSSRTCKPTKTERAGTFDETKNSEFGTDHDHRMSALKNNLPNPKEIASGSIYERRLSGVLQQAPFDHFPKRLSILTSRPPLQVISPNKTTSDTNSNFLSRQKKPESSEALSLSKGTSDLLTANHLEFGRPLPRSIEPRLARSLGISPSFQRDNRTKIILRRHTVPNFHLQAENSYSQTSATLGTACRISHSFSTSVLLSNSTTSRASEDQEAQSPVLRTQRSVPVEGIRRKLEIHRMLSDKHVGDRAKDSVPSDEAVHGDASTKPWFLASPLLRNIAHFMNKSIAGPTTNAGHSNPTSPPAQSKQDALTTRIASLLGDSPDLLMCNDPGPVFGSPLESQIESPDHIGVPLILEALIVGLKIHGLHSVGLYRSSGKQKEINRFICLANLTCLDPNVLLRLEAWKDVRVLAGLVKVFLTRLTTPIFDRESWEPLTCIVPENTEQWTVSLVAFTLLSILTQLEKTFIQMKSYSNFSPTITSPTSSLFGPSEWRFATLDYLFSHLRNVVALRSQNLVSYECISICFGPALFGHSPKISKLNKILEFMIQHWPWLVSKTFSERPTLIEVEVYLLSSRSVVTAESRLDLPLSSNSNSLVDESDSVCFDELLKELYCLFDRADRYHKSSISSMDGAIYSPSSLASITKNLIPAKRNSEFLRSSDAVVEQEASSSSLRHVEFTESVGSEKII